MSQKDHNQGQTDASNGVYRPPHDLAEEAFAFGDHLKEIHRDNQDYRDGYHHHQEQTDKK